jgi:hypothetical protein
MRHQNLSGSTNRRVASGLGVSGMPMEWLDAGSWRLPSGKALAEYALQAGFLVPQLFRANALESESKNLGGGRTSAGASAELENKDSDALKGGNR